MIIYKITNKINDKIYIGQTTRNLEERWKGHKYHKGCKVLYRAIKKYGKDNFKIESICSALDEKYLDELEINFIKIFNSLSPNGYNLSLGGKAFFRGRKHKELTKCLITNTLKNTKK